MKHWDDHIDLIDQYLQHGFALTPLRPRTKVPLLNNWSDRENSITKNTQQQLPLGNVGLLLAFCDPPLMSLDIDALDASSVWLAQHGINLDALLTDPHCVRIESGRPDRAKLLYRLEKPIRIQKVTKGRKTILELRCCDSKGGSVQDVLPPSIHPDTDNPYEWGAGSDWRNIPTAPSELLEVWDLLLSRQKTELVLNHSDIEGDIPRIKSAISTLDPDCSYDDWVTVGMALKSTGHNDALQWWLEWSSQGRKYTNETECVAKWNTLTPDGGITISTLFWLAKNADSKVVSIIGNQCLAITRQHFIKYSGRNRLCTDLGNVDRFIDITGGNVRFVPALEKWLGWQLNRWEMLPGVFEIARYVAQSIYSEAQQENDHARRDLLITWGLQSQNQSRLNAVMKCASQSDAISLDAVELDAQPTLLGVPNGTVDLTTGLLLLPSRDRFTTKSTAVAFDPTATCPRWDQFVLEIMDEDEELALFLQRIAGYALHGGNPEQVVAILHGAGSNGKSTFVGMLKTVFGDYARQVNPASFMSKSQNGTGPRDDLIRLFRTRLAISVESGDGEHLDEGLIKSVSGGDALYARGVYARTGIEFVPEFLLMLATNNKPIVKGTDYAIWRRLILIPFGRTFSNVSRDKGLLEQLNLERPGILNWIIKGYLDWHHNGLNQPSKVQQATNEYRGEMDILDDWITERCTYDGSSETRTSHLYADFKDWCVLEGSQEPDNRWFGRNLSNKGYQSVKRNNGARHRIGLRLLRPPIRGH